MIVLEDAYAYGFSICEARRLNDDEKAKYSDWYKDHGMVSVGNHINLPFVTWEDALVSEILHRPSDGEFFGCSNTARIITDAEKEALIALNERNEAKKKDEERTNEIVYLRTRLNKLESAKLYTEEEAKVARKMWNDIQNEGGEGYIPHFPTYGEYDAIKQRLNELENAK